MTREEAFKTLKDRIEQYTGGVRPGEREILLEAFAALRGPDIAPITGETSDGYHTFNELYHHRAVLFSVIVRRFKDKAWKSKKHHDGTMYDGMFIVGIDTPQGQATYHYDIEPYWAIFDCPELERAPEWDGHTPAQAIERIAALRGAQPDPETGLVPCGCGGKAILFHQPDIEGPGSDGDRWAVFCEKMCGMETSDMTSREYAVETWNTAMGYKGSAE